jgi:hypothetical protein
MNAPRTKAGLDLYHDTRSGMTILPDAMRSRILAIEAEAAAQPGQEFGMPDVDLTDDHCPVCHGPLASHVEAAAQPAPPTQEALERLDTLTRRIYATAQYHIEQGQSGPDIPRSMHRSRGEADMKWADELRAILAALAAEYARLAAMPGRTPAEQRAKPWTTEAERRQRVVDAGWNPDGETGE